MQLTIVEILESVKAKVSFVYDAIYPHYGQRVEGVVLDVDWWLAQDLGVKLERRRFMDAMSERKRSLAGQGRTPRDKDQEAVTRVLRNRPEVIVRTVKELPEAERKAIRAQIAENLEPLKQGMRDLKANASDIAAMLIETAESIQEARYTPEEISEIRSALDVLALALVEAEWKLEGSK